MSDENCKLLVTMGFKRKQAVDALHASDNNLERAIEMLTASDGNDHTAAADDDADRNQHGQNAGQRPHSSTPQVLVRLCEMLETNLNDVRSIAVKLSQEDDNFKKALIDVATKITFQLNQGGREFINGIDPKDEIVIQRLVSLGFDRTSVIQAFLEAEKDEQGALTFLLEKAAN